MRIAFYNVTTLTYIGGLETFCLEMAKVFSRRGHDVHQIAGVLPPNPETHAARDGHQVHGFPYRHMNDFPDFGTRFRKLCERLSFAGGALDFLSSLAPDVVIIQKPYDFPILARARRFKGLRGKVHYHAAGEDFFPADRLFRGAVDIWTSVSRDNAARVGRRYGRTVEVVPYGVDTERFNPSGPVARDIPTPPDRNVLYVGRLAGLKGVLVLIQAWAEVARACPDARLYVVGEGPQEREMKDLAAGRTPRGSVVFLGSRPHADLPAYYRSSRIFVYPTIVTEALGFGLLEAGASGCALIASDIGGMPEVLSGESGVLATPRDESALARTILSLLGNPARREELGRRARARMEERYSWSATADRFESLYAAFNRA